MNRTQSFVERLGFKFLRTVAPQWKAYTDLMVNPYDHWAEWNSGLGNGVHLLYAITRAQNPEVVVEIGSARGKSACAMALACSQNGRGKVFAIDPHTNNAWTHEGNENDNGNFMKDRLRDYQLEVYCEMVCTTSDQAARDWNRQIDILFIDGDHTFEGVSRDFELFQPWLTANSVVVFHDSLWEHEKSKVGFREDIGVPRFLHQLQEEGYDIVNFQSQHGMAILCPRAEGFDFMARSTQPTSLNSHE